MKISGFTFMRNTDKFYYPLAESILSILPLVDEFIIALGKGDDDDETEKIIQSISSDKIKIIHTLWNIEKFPSGTEFAHQTEIAKSHCTGDWLFYLQSDEVVHEKYIELIQNYCRYYLHDRDVEGFLFKYVHFFGDYNHFIESHAWYPQEIRIIRNLPEIHSWGDAQSFKFIQDFDGLNFHQKMNTRSLHVIKIPAEIYHYGWVRPPQLMQSKSKAMNKMYHNENKIEEEYSRKSFDFDYGCLNSLSIFTQDHPLVMKNFIANFNWKDQLHYEPNYKVSRELMKHEKLKYRILSWIENNLLNGKLIFGYKNWTILKNKFKR
ncbi:MAG: hypothetical protein ABIO44_10665 [Saprospiraceae bacterium]